MEPCGTLLLIDLREEKQPSTVAAIDQSKEKLEWHREVDDKI